MDIHNYSPNSVVTGTNYDDLIDNGAGNVTLNGLDGNDHILPRNVEHVSVNGGTGNDFIEGTGGIYLTLNGDEDNDLMFCSNTIPATATIPFTGSKTTRRF